VTAITAERHQSPAVSPFAFPHAELAAQTPFVPFSASEWPLPSAPTLAAFWLVLLSCLPLLVFESLPPFCLPLSISESSQLSCLPFCVFWSEPPSSLPHCGLP
jgi:hypothetical protein